MPSQQQMPSAADQVQSARKPNVGVSGLFPDEGIPKKPPPATAKPPVAQTPQAPEIMQKVLSALQAIKSKVAGVGGAPVG
jgi:hypothetical protein